MLNSKIHKNFAPSPLDYIQGKIEQAREGLKYASQPEALSPMGTLSQTTTPESIQQHRLADSEDDLGPRASSESDSGSIRSIPNTPLLPLHQKANSQKELSFVLRALSLLAQPISILLLCTLVYFIGSTAAPMLARFNLYQATYKFPFPLTLFCFQLIFAEAVLLLSTSLGKTLSHRRSTWAAMLPLPGALEWKVTSSMKLFPITFSFFAGYAAIYSCLEYVPMNYVMLFVSPTIIVQMACTKFYTPESPQSIYVAGACIFLFLGNVLSALTTQLPGMPSANKQGFLTGLLASVALPIHNCLAKKVIVSQEFKLANILHNVLLSSLGLVIPLMVISGEIFEISAHCYFLDEKGFWNMVIALCVVGFLAITSHFLLLLITTPLTVVVLNYARTALVQLPISFAINKTPLTYVNYLGFLISLTSVIFYLYLINYHRPKFGLQWKT